MRRLILSAMFFLFALASVSAEEKNQAKDDAGEQAAPAKHPEASGRVEGMASWYGGKFQGRRTASGEIFDTRKFTAAHRTLPFGTMVRLVNLDNGKTTVVRITDRGPFVDDRLIDVSQAAAVELDMMKTGLARVSLEVLPSDEGRGGTFYRIQVASFRDRENAKKLKAVLVEKGFTVFMESMASGSVRVNVDNVSASELEAARSALRSLGLEKHLVRKIGRD